MNEPTKKTSRGFYIALFVVVVIVVWASQPGSSNGVASTLVRSMNNVRQIGLALLLYAKDNDGKLPMLLSALSPDYLDADALPKLRFRDQDGKTDLDWLYYPKANINTLPDTTILAAAPRARRHGGKEERIVLHRDFSVTRMPEAQFQKQLAEELRAATP